MCDLRIWSSASGSRREAESKNFMDKKQEQFLALLRETFRVEADEHIRAIIAGLVAIERASDTERAPVIELIFREAHSLKGAARSVNLASVEALCLELESLFAAMKRNEITLSTEQLDGIHPAVDILAVLCASPGAVPSSEDKKKEQLALAALRRIIRDSEEKKAIPAEAWPPAAPSAHAPVIAATAEHTTDARPDASDISEAMETLITTPTIAQDIIRVSTRKLGAILLQTEELVGAKIAGNDHANELRKVAADFSHWNQRRGRQAMKLKRRRNDAPAAAELFESEMLFTRSLERSLHNLAKSAHQDAHHLGVIVDNLLEDTKKVLLLPCSHILNAFPKLVRDLARDQNKEAELVIHGEDIEIDRRSLDEIKGPLIHLLRNCIDHGIEEPEVRQQLGKPAHGVITITVTLVQGNQVEIAIGDDGAGIDAARVKQAAVRLGLITVDDATRLTEAEATALVFHSGLSTSPILTDLSGRGLGMTIVREKVEKLGGTITMNLTPGTGATFRLLVPLSRASFSGVYVDAAGQRFVIPTVSVVRVIRVKAGDIQTVENRQTISVGDRAVSLVRLRDVLALSGPDKRPNGAASPAVLVRAGEHQIAFLVDEVLGEQEVMVKKLGQQLPRVRNIAGASIASNGAIIPILNAIDLVESASTVDAPAKAGNTEEITGERPGRLLIAEDSITSRTLLKSILEGAGYEVVTAVDGMDALTALKTEPFDLVVSDVDMPRMNGFELTSRIRADKNLDELPVVLVTALSSNKDREYGIEVGASAYIVKSDFDQSNLIEIIKRFV